MALTSSFFRNVAEQRLAKGINKPRKGLKMVGKPVIIKLTDQDVKDTLDWLEKCKDKKVAKRLVSQYL